MPASIYDGFNHYLSPLEQQQQRQQQVMQAPHLVDSSGMAEVIATCNMEAGFQFMAVQGDRTFPVTVPVGGVVEGQRFYVPLTGAVSSLGGSFGAGGSHLSSHSGTFSPRSTEVTPFLLQSIVRLDREQDGEWKDSLWDCSKYGYFHPSLWNAFCCPIVLMAQILTRYQLNWYGECYQPTNSAKSSISRSNSSRSVGNRGSENGDKPKQRSASKKPPSSSSSSIPATFHLVILCLCLFTIFMLLLCVTPRRFWAAYEDVDLDDDNLIADDTKNMTSIQQELVIIEDNGNSKMYQVTVQLLLLVSLGAYTLYVLTKLRRLVRQRFGITASYQLEDVCVTLWCPCCTVAQLARQTCEYERQPAACCSPTGLGASWYFVT